MLEDTPFIELLVAQHALGEYPTWYELTFLGLKVFLTSEERDAAWGAAKAFWQGPLKENQLSRLSTSERFAKHQRQSTEAQRC